MTGKTLLENACIEVVGERKKEYYQLLSNLLLLNYSFIKKNDSRLFAKVTAILFDDELADKPHLLCEFIENVELNISFSKLDLVNTKKLLDIDPELTNSILIVNKLKKQVDNKEFFDLLKNNLKTDREKHINTTRIRQIGRY
ncbi:MAG: hypothetical protein ACTSQK_09485 [Candidatus Heimdallarchaeota archaeon]